MSELFRIESVKNEDQRYPTVGDYFRSGRTMVIRVSRMRNWRFMVLVAVHELIECALVRHRGISMKSITHFDRMYEKSRKDDSEPGDDTKSPYFREHQFATTVEKMLARELDVDWGEYGKAIYNL